MSRSLYLRAVSHRRWKADLLNLSVVILLQLILIWQVFRKSLPITDGWYIAVADEATKRDVYSDFYFPFPPLAIFFEGFLPNLFPNPFIAEQVIHTFFWIVFTVFCYVFCRYFFQSSIALWSTAVVTTAYLVQPGNIISGYFETMYLFLFGSLVLFLYMHRFQSSGALALLSGSLLGISLMIKQTTWVPGALLCLLCLYRARQGILTKTQCLFFSTGSLLPVGLCLFWAVGNNSLEPMAQNLLGGGGKSVNQLSVLTTFGSSFIPQHAMLVTVVAFLAMIFSRTPKETDDDLLGLRDFGLQIAILILLLMTFGLGISGVSAENIVSTFLVFFAILFARYLHYVYLSAPRNSEAPLDPVTWGPYKRLFGVALSLGILSSTAGLGARDHDLSPLRPNPLEWLTALGSTISANLVGVGCAGLMFLIWQSTQRGQKRVHERSAYVVVAVFFITLTFFNSFAGGDSIETWFMPLLLGFGFLAEIVVGGFRQSRTWAPLFWTSTVVLMLVCLTAVQVSVPYNWFGVTEEPLSAARSQPKSPVISSFRLSDSQTLDYDLLYEGLRSVQLEVGSTSLPVLFGSRNVGLSEMFQVDRYPVRCIVSWWDVCPEEEAERDLRTIVEQPPKIILWTFETEDTIESNELAWRDGYISALRRIQGWIYEQIDSGRYRVVASTKKNDDLTRYQELHTAVLVRTDL